MFKINTAKYEKVTSSSANNNYCNQKREEAFEDYMNGGSLNQCINRLNTRNPERYETTRLGRSSRQRH